MKLAKMHELDTKLFYWLNRFTTDKLTRLIRYVSKTGDGHLYLALGLVLFYSDKTHGGLFFYTAIMAYALEIPIYLILKQLFKRPRPEITLTNFTALITPSDKFSLPSGHTAAAFLMAVIIYHFYPTFGLLAIIWASMVGLSRVLLGVHYPSDVLLGAALGSSIACISLVVL